MKCPYCGYTESKVVDSRSIEDGIRRRRECMHCSARFTSYERIHTDTFMVIKKDSRREEFNRDKIITGISQACAKRPISNSDIQSLVDEVEKEIHGMGRIEIPTAIIGELVMDKLRALDRIAYIRFASVYRDFADIETLKKEVDALVEGSDKTTSQPPVAQLPLLPSMNSLDSGKRSGKGKIKAGGDILNGECK